MQGRLRNQGGKKQAKNIMNGCFVVCCWAAERGKGNVGKDRLCRKTENKVEKKQRIQ